jgi:hypothetical protein
MTTFLLAAVPIFILAIVFAVASVATAWMKNSSVAYTFLFTAGVLTVTGWVMIIVGTIIGVCLS